MSPSALGGGRSSIILFCLLFLVLAYVSWSYLPVSYAVEFAGIAAAEKPFGPRPSTIMPKIGIEVRLADGMTLSDPAYASVLFYRPRAKMKSSTSRLSRLSLNDSHRIHVPAVRCSFLDLDGSPASSEAWCADVKWEASSDEDVTDGGSREALELLTVTVVLCHTASRKGPKCRPLKESIQAMQSATAVVFVESFEFQAEGPGTAWALSRRIQTASLPLDDSTFLLNQLLLTPRRISRKDFLLVSDSGAREEDVAFSGMELKEIRKRAFRSPLLQTSVNLTRDQQVIELRSTRGWLDLLLLMGAMKAALDLIWALPIVFRWVCSLVVPAKKVARMTKKGGWAVSSLPATPRAHSLGSIPPTSKASKFFHPLARMPHHSREFDDFFRKPRQHPEGLPLLAPSLLVTNSPRHMQEPALVPGHHKRSLSLPGCYETSSGCETRDSSSSNAPDTSSQDVPESPLSARAEDSKTPRKSDNLSSLDSMWTHSNPIFSPSPCDVLPSTTEDSTARFGGRCEEEEASATAESELDSTAHAGRVRPSYTDDWAKPHLVVLPGGGNEQVEKRTRRGERKTATSPADTSFFNMSDAESDHASPKKEDPVAVALMFVDADEGNGSKRRSPEEFNEESARQLQWPLKDNETTKDIPVTMFTGRESLTKSSEAGEKVPASFSPSKSEANGNCSSSSQQTESSTSELHKGHGIGSETVEGDPLERESESLICLPGDGRMLQPRKGDDTGWIDGVGDGGGRGVEMGGVRGIRGDSDRSTLSYVANRLEGGQGGIEEGVLFPGHWRLERSNDDAEWDLQSEASYVSEVSVCSVSSKASDGQGKIGRRKAKEGAGVRRSTREKGSEGGKRAAWGAGPGLRSGSRSARSSSGSVKGEGSRSGRVCEIGDGEPGDRRASGSQVVGRALAMAGLKSGLSN